MCLNYPETISLTPGLWIVLHETSPWGHKVGDCCPQRRNDDHQAPTQSVSSVTQPCPTLCYPMVAARQASLSITNSQSLFKLMFMELVMPSSHLILCRPLLLLPSIFPSISVFTNESVLGASASGSVLPVNIQD